MTFWTMGGAAANFLAGIALARALGPDGRGLVAVLVSISGIVSVAAAGGTNVAFRAMFPLKIVNLRAYLAVSSALTIISLPLLTITGLLLAVLVDNRIAEVGILSSFVIFGATNLLWLQAKEGLNAAGRITTSALVGALGSILFALAIGTSALFWPESLLIVMAAYVLMNVFQLILSAVWLRLELRPGTRRGVRKLLKSGPAYLAYVFGQELAFGLTRPVIGIFSSLTQVGLFAVGAGMAEVLRLPVLAASQYVLHDSAKGTLNYKGILRLSGLWMAIIGMIAAALWPLAPTLITSFYGEQFLEGVLTFRILLIAQVLLVPFLIVSRGLVGLGSRWMASLPGIVGLVALAVSSPFLIPIWGAAGGAASCAITFASMSACAGILLTWQQSSRSPITI
ncbi:hypothetical protein ACWG8W_17445 [Citricoccus zhacaiensis]